MMVYEHTTWHTCKCVRVCVCACVYARECERVCMHVISEIKYPFQDNANSLIMCTLYTRGFF